MLEKVKQTKSNQKQYIETTYLFNNDTFKTLKKQ